MRKHKKPRLFIINVTQNDIRSGLPLNPEKCPVARALRRRLKCSVGEILVGFRVIVAAGIRVACTPAIEHFMSEFDCGRQVRPARFTLERVASD